MRTYSVVLVLLALLTACSTQSAPASAPTTAPASAPTTAPASAPTTAPAGQQFTGQTLVLMTHDSFSVSEQVVAAFEAQTGAKLQVLKSGDAGTMLNKAILSKTAPQADVIFGVDNSLMTRALAADILEPYESPAIKSIPARFQLDTSRRLLPVDYGYVMINYDRAYLTDKQLTAPTRLEELTRPEWKGRLVVENPATSSPGLAFMLATIGYFGTTGTYTWLDFWRDLRANDVAIAEGWDDAYNAKFSGSAGKGAYPLVVSYATSPAAEVFFSEGKLTEPPTGNVNAGAFEQIEFVGILKGTPRRALAEQLVDFLLSKPFQEDIPLQMFVYPVLPTATLPDVFQKFAIVPETPSSVTPEEIDRNREQWIEQWTRTVLR